MKSNKSLLIKDTTREERVQNVKRALDIGSLGLNGSVSSDVSKLLEEYIDGKTEIDEILKLTINKYKN